jgi:hypothetical protein
MHNIVFPLSLWSFMHYFIHSFSSRCSLVWLGRRLPTPLPYSLRMPSSLMQVLSACISLLRESGPSNQSEWHRFAIIINIHASACCLYHRSSVNYRLRITTSRSRTKYVCIITDVMFISRLHYFSHLFLHWSAYGGHNSCIAETEGNLIYFPS